MSSAAALHQILSVPPTSEQGTAAPVQDTDAAAAFTDLLTQLMTPAVTADARAQAEPEAASVATGAGPATDEQAGETASSDPTPADPQLAALVQSILVPQLAVTPQPQVLPVETPNECDIPPARSLMAEPPAPDATPEDADDTPAPNADLNTIKTELSALKLDTPEAIKPLPVETPGQTTSPAFSIQPVAAEATATPYTPAPQIAAQASALSHTAVEQLTQLSVAIQKRLGEGTTKFQLELKPADLGRIDVALTITAEGKVNAHLEFDTPITATTFAARESELRQQLTAAGLKLDGDALTFSSRPTETSQAQTQTQAQAQTQTSTAQTQAGFTDQQHGQQPRPNPRQAARALKQADQNAIEADLDASLAQLRQRPGSGRLALDLTV